MRKHRGAIFSFRLRIWIKSRRDLGRGSARALGRLLAASFRWGWHMARAHTHLAAASYWTWRRSRFMKRNRQAIRLITKTEHLAADLDSQAAAKN